MESINAVCVRAKTGRQKSGTFSHRGIAIEFGSWLSLEFKRYLIKKYQRLKEIENSRLHQEWNFQPTLAKVNYRIHADAIEESLIPPQLRKQQIAISWYKLYKFIVR